MRLPRAFPEIPFLRGCRRGLVHLEVNQCLHAALIVCWARTPVVLLLTRFCLEHIYFHELLCCKYLLFIQQTPLPQGLAAESLVIPHSLSSLFAQVGFPLSPTVTFTVSHPCGLGWCLPGLTG